MATYPCVPSGAQGRCGGFRGLGGDPPLPHPGDESGMSPVNCVERNGSERSRRSARRRGFRAELFGEEGRAQTCRFIASRATKRGAPSEGADADPANRGRGPLLASARPPGGCPPPGSSPVGTPLLVDRMGGRRNSIPRARVMKRCWRGSAHVPNQESFVTLTKTCAPWSPKEGEKRGKRDS